MGHHGCVIQIDQEANVHSDTEAVYTVPIRVPILVIMLCLGAND